MHRLPQAMQRHQLAPEVSVTVILPETSLRSRAQASLRKTETSPLKVYEVVFSAFAGAPISLGVCPPQPWLNSSKSCHMPS